MKEFEWQKEFSEKYADTEALFQKAIKENDNETIWACVNRVALALVKKKLKGLKIPEEDVYDMAMDVTIIAIDRMKRKGWADKLTSYLFWPVVGVVYDPKKKFNDLTVSWDKYLEETLGEEESNEENELEI